MALYNGTLPSTVRNYNNNSGDFSTTVDIINTTPIKLVGSVYPTDSFNSASCPISSILYGYNGSSWDKLRSSNFGVMLLKELRPSIASINSVSITNVNTMLLPSNNYRIGAIISNDGSQDLYVLFNDGIASSTNYSVKIASGGSYYVLPFPAYTGQINGIWASTGTGGTRITELTAQKQASYIANYDFTNASIYAPGSSYAIPEYTCASGSRYCQYSATQVTSGIGVDQAPIGTYGLAFWGGITNALNNPLTEVASGWNAGTATRTTSRTDPAGGTAGFRDVGASGQISSYYSLSAVNRTGTVYIKTETSSPSRWTCQGLADPITTLTTSYSRHTITRSTTGFFNMEGRNVSGYATSSAFDITHAFPQAEPGNFATDFHSGTRLGAKFSIAANKMPVDKRLRLYVAIAPGCSIGGSNDSTTALNIAAAGSGYSITAHQTTGVVTVTTNSSALSTAYGQTCVRATSASDVLEYCIEVGGGLNTIVKVRWQGGIVTTLGVSSSPQADWNISNETDVLCSSTTPFPGWIRKIKLLSSGTVFTGDWS